MTPTAKRKRNYWRIGTTLLVDVADDFCAKIYSNFVLKKRIHVVGDSHTRIFRRTPYFLVHHLGPATIFNLLKVNSTTRSREKFLKVVDGMRPQDQLVMIFGEIDCRIHIYMQYKRSDPPRSISDIIDQTLEKYERALDLLELKHIRPIITSICPAVKQGNIYGYPEYASREERAEINEEFNSKLSEICERRGLPYLDLYSQVVDDQKFIQSRYEDSDDAHLNAKTTPLIIHWFRERGFLPKQPDTTLPKTV